MAGDTITIRTTAEIAAAIGKLAEAMDRSRNWVIEAALRSYIDVQSWQIEGIRKGLAEVEAGDVVSHDEVFSELRKEITKRSK